jgi:glycosyltransferase involved in cell wall biosynthesis
VKIYVSSYQAISILRGGPNTQVRNTVKHLAAHGVDARLFDPWAPFAQGKCDLVHLFGANIGTYHFAREIAILGIPLVVSPILYSRHSAAFVHCGLTATRLLQKIGPGFWSDYSLGADICRWAQKVLPNTSAEAKLVAEGFGIPRQKITVIPNGVDGRFFHADPSIFRKAYGLDRFILNVGHIGHARKNVLKLIEALGAIDHPAVIIGRIIRGKYGEACLREAAKHKHILLLDGMENSSDLLASAYAACDVFVLPSQFETPGIAALEAGLAGAKVVITKYGGTDEYFGSHATYVEPESVDSIREGIVAALAAPRAEDLRRHIQTNFLWERVAEKTAAAYRETLAKGDA